MNKKRHINLLTFGLSVGLTTLSGCTDLLVKENSSIVVNTTGAAGGTKINASEALAAAYKDLGLYTDQAGIYALNEHTTAEMIPPLCAR